MYSGKFLYAQICNFWMYTLAFVTPPDNYLLRSAAQPFMGTLWRSKSWQASIWTIFVDTQLACQHEDGGGVNRVFFCGCDHTGEAISGFLLSLQMAMQLDSLEGHPKVVNVATWMPSSALNFTVTRVEIICSLTWNWDNKWLVEMLI